MMRSATSKIHGLVVIFAKRLNHPVSPACTPHFSSHAHQWRRQAVFSSSAAARSDQTLFSRLLSHFLFRPSFRGALKAHSSSPSTTTTLVGLRSLLEEGIRNLRMISLQKRPAAFDAGRSISSLRRLWRSWLPTGDGTVLGLIGANVAVFFLWRIANPAFMRKNFMISLDNFESWRLHTLITSAFSHSDLGHLLTNMLGLYFFGKSLGQLFGSKFLLKLYLTGALTGSVFFLVHKAFMVPSSKGYRGWDESRIPGLGASAAVNAITLLYVFLFPKSTIYFEMLIPVPAALIGAIYILTDLWRVTKRDGHISGEAHIGGAVVAAFWWARIRKHWI